MMETEAKLKFVNVISKTIFLSFKKRKKKRLRTKRQKQSIHKNRNGL